MGFRNFIRYRLEVAKRTFHPNAADEWQITLTPQGFVVSHTDFRPFLAKGFTDYRATWADIERVFAGQSDNFTLDTVWLTFVLTDGSSFSVPETASNWNQLLDQIPANLPNAAPKQDWFPQVTRTAFAPNITQLYPMPT